MRTNRVHLRKGKRIISLFLVILSLVCFLNGVLVAGESISDIEIDNSEEISVEGLESEEIPPGTISGFLWVDGNGSLGEDWNGVYDVGEIPLVDYPVSIYLSNDISSPIFETKTDLNGNYTFYSLSEGEYIIGISTTAIGDRKYLLPLLVTNESVFSSNLETNTAYSEPISLTPGDIVEKINCGMRLPMQKTARGLLPDLWNTPLFSSIKIDGYNWFVMKKQTINSGSNQVNCVLLMMKGTSYSTGAFGSSTNYEGSSLQSRMTSLYQGLATIKAIAVKPTLGSHSSTTDLSVPTATMAGTTTKDIMFALSYRDVYEINGNKSTPLHEVFTKYYAAQFYLRTSNNSSNVYGVHPKGNTIDPGIHYLSSNVDDVPAVWVSTSFAYDVTVHYVDTNGNPIASPDIYPVIYKEAFTLNSSSIPLVDGYEYIEWKEGLNGTINDRSVTVNIAEVKGNKDIYLIYNILPSETCFTVSKTVRGDMGNKTTKFKFAVSLYDKDMSAITNSEFSYEIKDSNGQVISTDSFFTDSNGEWEFFLKHKEEITIEKLSPDGYIRVVEEANSQYMVSYIDSEDILQVENSNNDTTPVALTEDPRTFSFFNERIYVPETGISKDGIFPSGISLLGLLVLLINSKRKMRQS